MSDRILAVRTDGFANVLLAEPALRALAMDGEVTLLCGTSARPAVELLPAVSSTLVHDVPWTASDRGVVDSAALHGLVEEIRDLAPSRAVIFTSQRQPVLPTALLLRLAGVPFIAARSLDRAGPLLDIRLSNDPTQHEVERNLELVEALGLPAPFDRRIHVRVGSPPSSVPPCSVVVHPGASHASATPPPAVWRELIARLAAEGHPVVLTGDHADDAAMALRRDPGVALDLVGRTTLPELAGTLSQASVVCAGNTGSLHLAAAVGTFAVGLFPSSVQPDRWRPWMVDHEIFSCDGTGSHLRRSWHPSQGRSCSTPHLETERPAQVDLAHLDRAHLDLKAVAAAVGRRVGGLVGIT